MNRECFPQLENRVYFENSGGTQPPMQVFDNFLRFTYGNYTQPGGYTSQSRSVEALVSEAREFTSCLINNKQGKTIFGSSATQLALNISNALTLASGDEIVLCNFSHESAIGSFTRIGGGVKTVFWNIRDEFKVEIADLCALVNERTKLVVIPHVSNVLGNKHDIKKIVAAVKSVNPSTKVYVDGVAYLAHDVIDVDDWGVDFYVASFYKFLGFRISFLYIKDDAFAMLRNINHSFIEDPISQLQVGGIQYELCSSVLGIRDYLRDMVGHETVTRATVVEAFERIRAHETALMAHLDQAELPGMRLLTDPSQPRVPIFSFHSDTYGVDNICLFLNQHGIECKTGNFYSKRLLDQFSVTKVLRISLAHYNSVEELDRFIALMGEFRTATEPCLLDHHMFDVEFSDELKATFDDLMVDQYYHTHRYRRFSMIDAEEWRTVGDSIFIQSDKYNNYLGNTTRKYEHIDQALLNDESFRVLVRTFMGAINAGSKQFRYFFVHQIRVMSSAKDAEVNAVPEGVHQDGYSYICISCVEQRNIECPFNEILDETHTVIENVMLRPNMNLILNDKKFWHNVSPLKHQGAEDGFRDIFVITAVS